MRYLVVNVLVLATLTLLAINASGIEWHTTVVDFSDDPPDTMTGLDSSIALDDQDYPYISYWQAAFGWDYFCLKCAHWTGNGWVIYGVDYSDHSGSNTSIALDSQDYPYIAYEDSWWGALKMAYWTGSYWSYQVVGSVYFEIDTSIAVDSQGYVQISFNDDGLNYAYWSGGLWELIDLEPTTADAYGISMHLDTDDHPHISYGSKSGWDLKYVYQTESTWENQLIDSQIGYTDTSIALDNLDYPHVSYFDNNPDEHLEYASWTGTTWDFQTVDSGFSANYGFNSMALDSQDNPHIAYYDQSNSLLKYARWTGSEWEIQVVDSDDLGVFGGTVFLALDSEDHPHISYYDYNHRRLKYAWYGDPLNAISLLSFTATPQDNSSVLLNWRVETTESEQIAGFNLYRRPLTTDVAESYSFPLQKKDAGWTKVNSCLITGQNPYTYTDNTVQQGKSYEYRLEAVLADESTEILGTASCAPAPPAFAITKVYPNPASDVLNIALTLPQSGGVTLELYDLTGRVVASKDIQAVSAGEFSDKLDVGGLANGVYTLRATQGDLSASERIVVVR